VGFAASWRRRRIGNSIHAGMVIVCDGTAETDARLERVLNYDPALGLLRHADAGYETARSEADEYRVHIPMMNVA